MGTPAGTPLYDGYQTLIEPANYPTVAFWEKEVTPPGFDGGGGKDVTTMRNTKVRTKMPKKLYDLTNCELVVAYDPAVVDTIKQMINENQLWEITHPDGSLDYFWGWLDQFNRNAHVEGEQPTANVVIMPSNLDAGNAEIELQHAGSGGTTTT